MVCRVDLASAELQQCSEDGSDSAEEESSVLRAYYRSFTIEEVQSKVALLVIDRQADLEWMKEFNRNKIYYSVRDVTRREERHFGSLEEVDALSIEVIDAVLTAYQELTTDVLDGQY